MGSCKDDLGAYNEPVVFDDATADALVTAASGLSSTISTMGSDVGVWASTASADFEGHYGDVFDSGAKAGQEDCTNISAALDDLVSEVRALKSAAATERRRRAVAKEGVGGPSGRGEPVQAGVGLVDRRGQAACRPGSGTVARAS